jgi:predicted TIM-barrel fold metal-dependent hydrolase
MTSASPTYRLIDADTHVNEPPDLWVSRVPSKYAEHVPRMERFEEGDAWVLDLVKDPINFGFNVAAAMPRDQRKAWVRFEDIPRGGYDPVVRLEEMDADAVDAAVFYPTPRLSHLMIAHPDPDLHLSMIQAYNDWLIEYCDHAPSRLGAIPIIPNRGVEQAVAEIERLATKRSVAGLLMGCYPHGDRDMAPEDDAVWAAVAATGLALHIHVGFIDEFPKDIYAPGRLTAGHAASDLRFLQSPGIMVQFVNSGVFDRFPTLQVAMVETDAGWVPYVKEQMDNRYRRRTPGKVVRTKRVPSQVIDDHFTYTILTDRFALANRHRIGVDKLLWSSDFPHTGSDWPESWKRIDAEFDGMDPAERHAILAGNAQRLYRFDTKA